MTINWGYAGKKWRRLNSAQMIIEKTVKKTERKHK